MRIVKDYSLTGTVHNVVNVVLGSSKAAIAQISLDQALSPAGLQEIKAHPATLDVVQMEIGSGRRA